MDKVYVKFPKTGLGNLLVIWARARVFSHINQLPLVTSPWWGIRWGAWFRKEQKKRLYWGYFKETGLISRIKLKTFLLNSKTISEPSIEKLNTTEKSNENKLFLFNQVINSDDLFGGIRPYRDFIRDEIYKMLNPKLLSQLQKFEVPLMSIHIRRGDFKLGSTITPLSFFIECIQTVRLIANKDMPVTIFTDAERNEIIEILELPNVKLATPKPDILDILLMSKSQVIVLSYGSTFSYWGAFLSDAVVLRPANDWQDSLRPMYVNENKFEGAFNVNNPLVIEGIKNGLK